MKLKNIDTQQHGFSDGLKSSNIFLKKNDRSNLLNYEILYNQ